MAKEKLEQLQRLVETNFELRRFIVTIDVSKNSGFGMTEDEIMKKTGMDKQEVYRMLAQLQNLEVLAFKCTQTGTAGNFAFFFRLDPNIKVSLVVTES